MARMPRIDLPNTPLHIIQRGNNRQKCFYKKKDFILYIRWLKEYAKKFDVSIHAWVLMTNHVHILCTPKKAKSISLVMQSLGRRYVRYFNHAYERTGTLWEGRFKSCIVQSDSYFLNVQKYIELNPVRAGMVSHPVDYIWSSYQINALGKHSDLCTPHYLYSSLGMNKSQRLVNYRKFVEQSLTEEILQEIRSSVNKELVLGSIHFKTEVENISKRRVIPRKAGRPKKIS